MKPILRFRHCAVALGFGLAIAAYCCYGGIIDTVHFYSPDGYEGPVQGHFVDFGRAPQRFMVTGWNNEMERAQSDATPSKYDWSEESYDYGNGKYKKLRARNLEARGDYTAAVRAYSMLPRSASLDRFIRDRKEILASNGGKEVTGLRDYLRLTYLQEFGDSDRTEEIGKLKVDPILVPHIRYVAAESYADYRERARAYATAHYNVAPSERGEAGLIMAARTLANSDVVPATKEDWAVATHHARELLRAYPKSRFRFSAVGILAIAEAASGRLDSASKLFAKWESMGKTETDRWKASLTWARVLGHAGLRDKAASAGLRAWALPSSADEHTKSSQVVKEALMLMDEAATKRFRTRVRQEPSLLSAYIGLRIEDTKLSITDERELAKFAAEGVLGMRKPGAGLLARVAQLNYNIGRYPSARLVAQRALKSPGSEEDRGRARYVLAGSLARLGARSSAIRNYQALLKSRAPDYLRKSAREPLARLYELEGRNTDALLTYIDLNYKLDAALSADAFCSIPELAQAIRRMPPSQKRDVLTFTLAKRYLRVGDYAATRAILRRMGGTKVARWGLSKKEFLELSPHIGWSNDDNFVPDPLVSLAKLETLESKIRRARKYDAKAEALYNKAAYIYQNHDLLFYSPGLWKSERAFSIAMYWNPDLASARQKKALMAHFWDHECYAHSFRICREIIRRYPKSRVMPKALYTAAISADHLSNMNEWWRNQPLGLETQAARYLTRLFMTFPKNPLATPAKKYAPVFDPSVISWKP